MKLNKKAAIPAIAWVIIAVIGIFLAKEAGLFSIFIPQVGQPPGGDSLVNPIYYPATNQPPQECETTPASVLFRTENLDYPSGSHIARTSVCGQILSKYVYYTCYNCNGQGTSNPPSGNYLYQIPGTIAAWTQGPGNTLSLYSNGNNLFVVGTYNNKYAWLVYNPTSYGSLSTSSSPIDPAKEVSCGGTPQQDEGKYKCYDGNIYLQYCGDFGSALSITCPTSQSCNFITGYSIQGQSYDITKCGTSAQLFKPNIALCIGNTLYQTNAQGTLLNSTSCYSCSQGQCYDCANNDKRCASDTQTQICYGGHWQNDELCQGDNTCVDGECTNQYFPGQQRCNGNQPQIRNANNNGWIDNGDSCDLACYMNGNEATCQLQCQVGYICAGGYLQNCIASDRDNELENIGACTSGICSSQSTCQPTHQIGDKYCSGGNVYIGQNSGNQYDINGGVVGNLFQTCANGCTPDGQNNAHCNSAPGCNGHFGQSICLDPILRKVCSEDGQSYTQSEDCSQTYNDGFCEIVNEQGICSQPEAECSGNSICTGNQIFTCNNGQIGDLINNCNGLGCYTDSNNLPKCNDECQTVGSYQCKNGDSYQCINNATANQKQLILSQTCGSGCNSGTGQCNYLGPPGSYFCAGPNNNQIYRVTESQGTELIETCGSGGSYCSPGVGYCKYCEQGEIFCSANNDQQLLCQNEQTGQTSIFNECPAGCFIGSQNSYCDQLSFTLTTPLNFNPSEPVLVGVHLKGSQSNNNLINIPVTITLTGPGAPSPVTVNTGGNGRVNYNFNTLSLGDYALEIETPYETFNYNLRVTNDFLINLFGSPTILSVPNQIWKIQVSAQSESGSPNSLVIINQPAELDLDVAGTTIEGRWDLIVGNNAQPGNYIVSLSADNQEPQDIAFEIQKPTLQISTNIPLSDKTGSKTYDINVKGPTTIDGQVNNIAPTSIIAKINSNDITLLPRGAGQYVLQYDFASEGPYTININAEKDGYDSGQSSSTLQISQSGTVQPGGSAGNNTTTNTITNITSSVPWWIWIVIVGGIIFFMTRKGGRN